MTSHEAHLIQLHDATLRALQFDWSTGEVRLELSAVLDGSTSSPVVLHAREVSLLRCPRQAPWGWSASINEVRHSSAHAGRVRLEVEMQRRTEMWSQLQCRAEALQARYRARLATQDAQPPGPAALQGEEGAGRRSAPPTAARSPGPAHVGSSRVAL